MTPKLQRIVRPMISDRCDPRPAQAAYFVQLVAYPVTAFCASVERFWGDYLSTHREVLR